MTRRLLALLLALLAAGLVGCSDSDDAPARVPNELRDAFRSLEQRSSRAAFTITTTTTTLGERTVSRIGGEVVGEGPRRASYALTIDGGPELRVLRYDDRVYLLSTTGGRPAVLTGPAEATIEGYLPAFERSSLDLVAEMHAEAPLQRAGAELRRYAGTLDPDAVRRQYASEIADAHGTDAGERFAEALTIEGRLTVLLDAEGRIVEQRTVQTQTVDPPGSGTTPADAPLRQETVLVATYSDHGAPITVDPPAEPARIDDAEQVERMLAELGEADEIAKQALRDAAGILLDLRREAGGGAVTIADLYQLAPDIEWQSTDPARADRREVVVESSADGFVLRTTSASGRVYTYDLDTTRTPRLLRTCGPGCTW